MSYVNTSIQEERQLQNPLRYLQPQQNLFRKNCFLDPNCFGNKNKKNDTCFIDTGTWKLWVNTYY